MMEDTIRQRRKAFEAFLTRAKSIPELSLVLAEFLDIKNHIDEYERRVEEEYQGSCWTDTASEAHHENRASEMYTTSSQPKRNTQKQQSHSMKPYRLLREIEFRSVSKILNETLSGDLFSILPPHIQTEQFQLSYATHRDGWSMISFYKRIGTTSPLILLVRIEGSAAVIGVFLTAALGPPSYELKGNCDCFVFRLDGLSTAYYNCPVIDKDADASSPTLWEFAMATPEYLAFGASASLSCNAIRLSDDLTRCSCGPSDTYANPRLVDSSLRNPLTVVDVEVFASGGVG